MNTVLEVTLFGADPWWVVLIKAVAIFVVVLVLTLFNIVFERKVVGKMQHRLGPTMNGPGGSLQSLADGMKLMFKEDFRPKGADKVVFTLAPFVTSIPAITAWAVIPLGGTVHIGSFSTNLQLTDLPVSVLFIVAIGSIGVYGIVLAGWSSGSTYALLGGLRSSAQVISYEVAMGLSLVAVFLYAGSMSTHDIVEKQAQDITFFGFHFPVWFCIQLIPSFIIYAISMVGETNRAPFDLPEAEGELVGGFHTEYSGMRFAMFFMAEYINMSTVSALAATLFLGGYKAPLPFNLVPALNNPWLGPIWLLAKVVALIFVFVWLRGSLPRLRYDQFMRLGWKFLIPISLIWIVLVAVLRAGMRQGWFTGPVMIAIAVVFLIAVVLTFFVGGTDEPEPAKRRAFDAFAGGYPVPPGAGEELPELATVVPGTTEADPQAGPRRAADGQSARDVAMGREPARSRSAGEDS